MSRPTHTAPPHSANADVDIVLSTAGVLFLRLLVEDDGLGAQVLTFVHEALQRLASVQDVGDIFVHNILDLVQILQQ